MCRSLNSPSSSLGCLPVRQEIASLRFLLRASEISFHLQLIAHRPRRPVVTGASPAREVWLTRWRPLLRWRQMPEKCRSQSPTCRWVFGRFRWEKKRAILRCVAMSVRTCFLADGRICQRPTVQLRVRHQGDSADGARPARHELGEDRCDGCGFEMWWREFHFTFFVDFCGKRNGTI